MTESPKVPGTVEDSHDALAGEMRRADDMAELPMQVQDWAARVEQLGSQWERIVASWKREEEMWEARESEIAKVRERLISYAEMVHNKPWEHIDNRTMAELLRNEAARLGGAT